ncbi:DUF2510 domain-containing protein [Kitasatospora sp. NPDC028055]|uniref:DUF2510 domain-containing protein n=1 Tax=Kitasatospora sp. NPDC028055 TaxID=3155653 RepID=UPI00340E2B53
MTNSTPPGWYPIPGTDNASGYERWWGGNAWTNEVRPLQGTAVQGAAVQPDHGYGFGGPGYGYPGGHTAQDPNYGYPAAGYGYPGPGGPAYPPPPPSPARRRARPGVIVGAVAGTLAVAGIVAAFAFSHGNTPLADPTPAPTLSDSQGTLPPPSPNPTPTPAPPAPTTPRPAPSATGVAPDPQHALTVPVLDGWATESDRPNWSMFEGTGQYSCNGGHRCVRGMFAVSKEVVQGATAKEAADSAMPGWAGGLYPGITQHTDYGSAPMSVDGVPGYVARWHVRTSTGAQGYVLLATFQAKGGGYVVFEGSVDDDALSPDKGALERILSGVRQSGSAATT